MHKKGGDEMKKFGWVCYLICFLGLGVFLGFFISYLELFNAPTIKRTVVLVLLIPVAFIFLYFNVLFHEFGHYVFGKLTGYKFVSFRIASHVFYRDKDGNMKKTKNKVPGIAGQCLMYYDKPYTDKLPFFWYNMGGVIFNIILFGLSFLVVYLGIENYFVSIFGAVSATISLFLGLSNFLPVIDHNDGANMHNVIKNSDCKKSFYDQLNFSRALVLGIDMREVETQDYEFNSVSPVALSGYDIIYSKRILDGDIEKAGEIIAYFEDNLDKISKNFRPMVTVEINNYNAFYKKDYSKIASRIDELPKKIRKFLSKIREVSLTMGYIVYLVYGLNKYDEALEMIHEEEALINNHHYVSLREPMINEINIVKEDIKRFKGEISDSDEEISANNEEIS